MKKTVDLLIMAAGKGERMQAKINKTLLLLNGKPVFCHSLQLAIEIPWIENIFLAVPATEIPLFTQAIKQHFFTKKTIEVFAGGSQRYDSVQQGMKKINAACSTAQYVFVHDAARPLGSRALWEKIYLALAPDKIVCPYWPINGSVHEQKNNKTCAMAVQQYITTQTPQAFAKKWIAPAFFSPNYHVNKPSEELRALQLQGVEPVYVLGEWENSKLTIAPDWQWMSKVASILPME